MSRTTILCIAALVVASCITFASALTGCHVSVTSTPRSYTWQDNGKTFKSYDISVTNVGTCPVNDVRLNMQPDGSSVVFSQTWNLFKQDPTHFALQNFGQTLYPGQNFGGAGFIIGYSPSSSSGNVVTSLVSGICAATGDCASNNIDGEIQTCGDLNCGPQGVCISDGGLPRCITTGTTSGSTTGTTGGTTGSSTTGTTGGTTGTTGTTGGTTGSSGECSASVTMTPRPASNAGNWTDEAGRPNQIYDISVTNSGTCAITMIKLAFTLPSNSLSYISQRWNLDVNYVVNTYGPIPVNGGFGGAGVVLTGPGPLGVNIASKTCNCQ